MKTARNAQERKIPLVTAIIALVFCSLVIFGAVSVIIARFGGNSYGDVGLHLDGTWHIEAPTFNDESITFVFQGDSFTSVTESIIFGASPEDIESIRDFHVIQSGASLYSEDIGDGNYLLRITLQGTFLLDGNSILLTTDSDMTLLLPFYWQGEALIINGDRYFKYTNIP